MKKSLNVTVLLSSCAAVFLAAALLTQADAAVQQKKDLACAKAFEALGLIGDTSAVDVLIKGMKAKDLITRCYAIEALGRLGDKKALPYLKEQLKDADLRVKIASTRALLTLGEKGMEGDLLGFLNSKDPSVRTATLDQLAYFRQKYLDRITRVLAEDKSPAVRTKAIQILGVNKYSPASGLLLKALEDPDTYVRQAACIAIGKVGYEGAKALLAKKIEDPQAIVRAAAKEGYGMLKGAGGIPGDSYIKLLWKDMESKEAVLKASSFISLASARQVKVLPILLQEVVNPSSSMLLRRVAARALVALKPAVDASFDEMAKSRQSLLSSQNLELSYKVGGKKLITVLTAALINEKDPLHKEAAGIIGELGDRSALPELRKALSQDDPEVVAGVAYILGSFKDKQSAPSLIRLCKSYGF